MQSLPDGTHLIHIGPQKTGSTAMQAALHHARGTLAEHGVCYPGPGMRAMEAMGAGLGFATPRGGGRNRPEAWQDLLAQVQDPRYRLVVVSHEGFGRAEGQQLRDVVDSLGGGQPHVVAVARRYDRLLPSQWQQRVKARYTRSYEDYLRVVLGEPQPEEWVWNNLWVPHATAELVKRWTDVVGEDHFTLVIGDDEDRRLVPRTFESMLGVPQGVLDLEVVKNRSLSYGEAELLRSVNALWERRGWTEREYFLLVKRGLIPRLVNADKVPGDPAIPPLPQWAAERLAEIGDARIEALKGLCIEIVGDLEALRTSPDIGVAAPDGPVTVPLEVAARALEGVSARALKQRRSLKRRSSGDGKKARKRRTR